MSENNSATEIGSKAKRKEKALDELLAGRSTSEVAQTVGVTERTIFRWLGESEFRRAFQTRRRSRFLQGLGSVQTLATSAATTLEAIVADPESSSASRVAAARSILQYACQSFELDDVEERLAELESLSEESDVINGDWP